MEKFFQYLPLIFQYGSKVKDILDLASSNIEIVDRIKKQVPGIASLLEQYGAYLFPKAAAAIHIVGGAVAAYDPNVTKWIQGACNKVVPPTPPLDVDGIYGQKTRDAVMLLQKKLGLSEIDGLAGRITQAAIDTWEAEQAKGAVK